jgi:transposase-like protein
MFIMSKRYPREFLDDVVRAARNRGSGVTLAQIADDFGVSKASLSWWLRAADVEDGKRPALSDDDLAENSVLRKRVKLLEQENEVLRRAAAYLSQAKPAGKMMYPLVRELAEDGIPVTVTCRALNLARQPYYRWLNQPVTDTGLNKAHIANTVFNAHRDDPEFGYWFLADEARDAGHDVCDRTVWRICSDVGWWSVFDKKGTQSLSTGHAGSRRSRASDLHRRGSEPTVADRHH